ncbi:MULTISPECIES: DUF6457 domain-containing protein [unclassified Streptomyces]|uniref:DUF6457 domain-containing protein n=1 Tax=unclassified Streptomyces TaxID=2593676 RepID=UPI002DDBDF0E|nr:MULTISPECIES: DUF6457 domain-containing protein [unclassified Streptomyces]WSA93576.1 molybdenum cofactor guanylyltransferase [Streptomyces sp. NBC_01795]WSB77946.1 molybdenum cofactor guanylyltransferase [Streptomyces sp. NBC_01775]WSS42622.1 molybdenum cofactor guanylyltransferase [Streptomyces sp. NBC_01187]
MTQASGPAPTTPGAGAPRRTYGALVLAGGGASRLGGTDKPAVTVGGRPLLDRVLSACADATASVVVGPRRPTYRAVAWAREDPPGGGPLTGLHAGLSRLDALDEAHGAGGAPRGLSDPVLVVSADLPFLGADTVRALLDIPAGYEGAVVHDGRDQPLLAAYRAEPLRRELALLRTEYGYLSGLPLRLLLPGLKLHRVTSPAAVAAALDCDTWDDIATARARIREHGTVLDEWITAVKAELGIETEVDTATLLDLARDAAHGVARPAAPLTTFLVGYAAGRADGTPEDIARAAAKAAELARRWAAEDQEHPTNSQDAEDER